MDEVIAWFDEKSTVWCKDHEPKQAEVEGELTTVLRTDHWAGDVGCCCVCGMWIGDLHYKANA